MFDQLFTEVCVEDQETVTGGYDLNASLTSFFAQQTTSTTGSQSGFGGSIAGGSNSSTTVFTTGLTLNYFNGVTPTPPPPPPGPGPGPVPVNP